MTGVLTYTETDNWGDIVYSEGTDFEYTLSTNVNGLSYVTMIDEESMTRSRYEVTATRLLLFVEKNGYIEYKKQ